MTEGLRIAVLGGVPPVLGGGGLERQAEETVAALRRRGHDAFFAARSAEPREFDVLHAIGAEPDAWQWLAHWRRNAAPLVVSPVVVVPQSRVWIERFAARAPLRSWGPRMRADILRRADLGVAQTEFEASLMRSLGSSQVAVVPNGVDSALRGLPRSASTSEPFVLLLGTVSRRKRQAEAIKAIHNVRTVVVGGFDGSESEEQDFKQVVRSAGATWLGEVRDRREIANLLSSASALVHLSLAEGQALALLEAIAVGTPVIATRLPPNVELANLYPDHVMLVGKPADVDHAISQLAPAATRSVPDVPTWDDVASKLELLYREVMAGAAPAR